MKRGNGRCKWFSDCLAEMTTSKCNERRKTVIIRSYDFIIVRLYHRENCHRSREEQQQEYPLSKWQLQTWRRKAMGKSSHDVTATGVREWRDDGKILLRRGECRRDVERDDVKILLRRQAADVRRDEEKIGYVLTTASVTFSTMRKSSYYTITAGAMIEIRWENPLTTWLLHTCVM